MALATKTLKLKLWERGIIKLPQVVIEEQGLGKESTMSVMYGKNYTCVIILPENTKLNDRMLERINILVNEPLG